MVLVLLLSNGVLNKNQKDIYNKFKLNIGVMNIQILLFLCKKDVYFQVIETPKTKIIKKRIIIA